MVVDCEATLEELRNAYSRLPTDMHPAQTLQNMLGGCRSMSQGFCLINKAGVHSSAGNVAAIVKEEKHFPDVIVLSEDEASSQGGSDYYVSDSETEEEQDEVRRRSFPSLFKFFAERTSSATRNEIKVEAAPAECDRFRDDAPVQESAEESEDSYDCEVAICSRSQWEKAAQKKRKSDPRSLESTGRVVTATAAAAASASSAAAAAAAAADGEEAHKVKKRKRVEAERKLEMETRQKQRVEEIRKAQLNEKRNMGLKEQVRVEVESELQHIAHVCKDMGSLLLSLGIPIGDGSFQQVNSAYKKALLKFHPDRASANADIRLQVEAEEKFKLIAKLKSTLTR